MSLSTTLHLVDNGIEGNSWCSCCQSTSCYFDVFKERMINAMNNQYYCDKSGKGDKVKYTDLDGNKLKNSTLRKSMYKYYIYYRH